MPYLNRNGDDIYFETHGSGPPLLMTHGFSATHAMWKPNVAALAERHTLILWDLRGHGTSAAPHDASRYGEALAVDDMAALLDHCGFDKAIIGGLSLGGYLSLAFHATYPERVQALLIIDCGPGYRKDEPREAWNRTAEARAVDLETNGLAALEGGTAERATATHNDPVGLAYAARYLLTQHSPQVINSLPGIEVPSLVVVGAADEPFLAASNYMAGKIPGAELLTVPDAGHAVNLDQPQAFNDGVLTFLSSRGL